MRDESEGVCLIYMTLTLPSCVVSSTNVFLDEFG